MEVFKLSLGVRIRGPFGDIDFLSKPEVRRVPVKQFPSYYLGKSEPQALISTDLLSTVFDMAPPFPNTPKP